MHPLELSAHKDPNPNQSDLTVPKDNGVLQSPTPSFAESFSTAFTSPGDEIQGAARFILPSLAPPRSLRKTVSVDSFAQYNHDGFRNQSNRFPEPSGSHVYGIVPETQRGSDAQVWPRRHHDESLISHHLDRESPSPPDSDVERYDPVEQAAIEHFQHVSLKSQDPSQAPIRPGDLSLPSRTQSSSAVASPSSYGTREHLPSISASLHISSRRGSAFATTAARVRSGSLGYNPSKRSIINPPISPPVN